MYEPCHRGLSWSYHAYVVAIQQDLGQLGRVAVVATAFPSQSPNLHTKHVQRVRISQFSHVLEDDVDVVIETQKGAAELCKRALVEVKSLVMEAYEPLSPFMMTHILDPTHLSTSSVIHCLVSVCLARVVVRKSLPRGCT